ncbi:BatD family protein [Ensifer sp. HO-A22]|uniref:BatD family protein n=1 Tax=Ensifer oleiphilus TaxID=2742698 RepID=A0A7Y6QBY5_9HYPH|nr:BatD family protein [Ensifer oleiphilus]NVD42535.1 BatD family protein [Ensifer oleiphilus]
MTLRIWPTLLVFTAFWLSLANPALAAEPFARATLVTKGTIYAGQQVEIDVDVFAPNYFLSPPEFPLFDLPGTVVTMPDDRGLNLNETINGAAFSGIRKTYMITPQAAGDYVLPSVDIPFGYAAVPGETTQARVKLPALRFTVTAVPGGAAGQPAVTAAKVTITQTFDRDPASLSAGDALVRTVAVNAQGLAAMMIPEPSFDAPEGARVYIHDPALSDDKSDRGEFRGGIRKDTATYVFAKAGDYKIPAITLQWFDPALGKAQSAEAPGAKVSVAAAPARETDLAPPSPSPDKAPFDWLWWVAAGLAVAAFALFIHLAAILAGRVQAWFDEVQADRAQSEPTAFRRVGEGCRSGDAHRLEAAIDAWSRMTGNVPLTQWLDRFADPGTKAAFSQHQQSLYRLAEATPTPDLLPLRAGLSKARRRWLEQTSDIESAPANELPDLNPTLEADLPTAR